MKKIILLLVVVAVGLLIFLQTKTNPEIEGKTCGGIANLQCGGGYYCKLGNNFPDASGTCQKKTIPMKIQELFSGNSIY